MKRLLVLLCASILLCGCHNSGTNVDKFDNLHIEPNQTTEADLRKQLGDPQSEGVHNGDRQLIWTGSTFRGFGGWGRHAAKHLNVTIRNGVVTDYQVFDSEKGD